MPKGFISLQELSAALSFLIPLHTICRTTSHFYWWKKRLGASGAEKFVEVKLAAAASTLGAGEDRRVEVVLRNGRSLRVGPGFDPELVRALAAVVESAA